MKALITGINGFVGQYLFTELKENGYEVAGTYIGEKGKLDCPMFQADITKQEELNKAIKEFKPEIVFHLAAYSDVGSSFEKADLVVKINARGTENLFKAITEAGIKCKVIVVGSAQEYGIPERLPITEEHPLKPNNPYAKSKVQAEGYAMQYENAIITRSFNHTGPGQADNFVLSSFAHQIALIEQKKQEPVIQVGNLDAKRDFLDVRDVVKAYRLLGEKGQIGEAYNVCSATAYQISELLDRLVGLSTAEIMITRDSSRLRPIDIPVLQGDHSKLTGHTGWYPEIHIARTLRDLLDYWRKH